jgi:hypothetical protein
MPCRTGMPRRCVVHLSLCMLCRVVFVMELANAQMTTDKICFIYKSNPSPHACLSILLSIPTTAGKLLSAVILDTRYHTRRLVKAGSSNDHDARALLQKHLSRTTSSSRSRSSYLGMYCSTEDDSMVR